MIQTLGVIFSCFEMSLLRHLHLFDQKFTTNSIIVKYYYIIKFKLLQILIVNCILSLI